ncbi:MAG: hypothetical protein MJK04_02355, partial [Psychrosphaera sp.]|nr:hypothetical protein [Psychrosphaera sp.]
MKFSIGAVLPGIALAAASLSAHAQVTQPTEVSAKARLEVAERVNPFARVSNVMTAEPLSADDSLGTLE